MLWNQSSAIGLANATCAQCGGLGVLPSRGGKLAPCNCALRAVFRACFNRFRDCVENGAHASTVSLEFCRGRDGRRTYSRKKEEFMADFCLISRRTLDDLEYKIFRFHFLLGADWRLCCRRLAMDRGNFFHSVYRIEQKLGHAFAETQPYSIYPIDEYFGGTMRRPLQSTAAISPRTKLPLLVRPRALAPGLALTA
jgi:hypothetical protein